MARNLVTFNSIVKELELNYVDSFNPDRSFKEAIGAFLSTVDPYTEYYDSEEQEALEKMTTGEYGGIGSVIMERDGSTFVDNLFFIVWWVRRVLPVCQGLLSRDAES